MKLLTPQSRQDNAALELTKKLLRTKEVEELVKSWNKKLANAEADFQNMLAGQRTRYAEEEKEHNFRKAEMKKEITELEIKKANALIPASIITFGGESRLDEAVKFLFELKEREDKIEDLTDRLEDKLDNVGEREQNVALKEQKLLIAEEGIKNQQNSTAEQAKQLTIDLKNFAERVEKTDNDIDERKSAMVLQDRTLVSRENSLNTKERELKDLAKRLFDERGTLDRAWQELSRLKNNLLNK